MNNGYEEFFINDKHYYTHRYIAEKYILGRPLQDTEIVRHIDGDRQNNNPGNLIVFKTTSDHSKYHSVKSSILKNNNNVWEVVAMFGIKGYKRANLLKEYYGYYKNNPFESKLIEKPKTNIYLDKELSNEYNLCPYCNKNMKQKYSERCFDCRKAYKRELFKEKHKDQFYDVNNIGEELLPLVLNNSFTDLSKKFRVSDKAIVKWCKMYEIPSNLAEKREYYQKKKIPFTFVVNK